MESLPENKKTVNVNNEADALISNTPGKSGESLPPASPTPVATSPASAGPVKGKPRGPYKKTRDRIAAPPVQPSSDPLQPNQIVVSPEMKQHAGSINGTFNLAMIILMGEEAALSVEEKSALDSSLAEYMTVKGMKPSPLFALLSAYGMVAAARISKPKPRERLSAIWTGLKAKFARKKKDYSTEPQIDLGSKA